MLTAILFIITLGILIAVHEFGHFIAAKTFKLRVDEFAFGFPPKLLSKTWRGTKYILNLLPFGGYVKIYGENAPGKDPNEDPTRSYYAQPAWKRFTIIVAGVVMNFLIGWIAFAIFVFFAGIPQAVYVERALPGSPAEQLGLVKGDKIEGFKNVPEFIQFVERNAGQEIKINGKLIIPRLDPPANEGRLGVVLRNGDFDRYNIFTSIYYGFTDAVQTAAAIIQSLANLVAGAFSGGGEVLKTLTGPVGIVGEIGSISKNGALAIIQFLGLISINLAVFNLLPIPALDGGRLLFIIIEKIIGRRMNVQHEAIANLIGFSFLIILAITVTINDIYKLFV